MTGNGLKKRLDEILCPICRWEREGCDGGGCPSKAAVLDLFKKETDDLKKRDTYGCAQKCAIVEDLNAQIKELIKEFGGKE